MLIKSAVQLAVPVIISMGRSTASLGLRFTFFAQEYSRCARAHSPKHRGLPSSGKAFMESSGPWSKNTAGVEPITAIETLGNSSGVEDSSVDFIRAQFIIVRDQIPLAFASLNASMWQHKNPQDLVKRFKGFTSIQEVFPLSKSTLPLHMAHSPEIILTHWEGMIPVQQVKKLIVEVAREAGMFDALALI